MKIVRHNADHSFSVSPYYSASLNYCFDDAYIASDNIIRGYLKQIVLRWATKEGEIGNKILFLAFEHTLYIPFFIFWKKEIKCNVKWEIQDTFPGKSRIKIDIAAKNISKKNYDVINAVATEFKNKTVADFYYELKRIA